MSVQFKILYIKLSNLKEYMSSINQIYIIVKSLIQNNSEIINNNSKESFNSLSSSREGFTDPISV